MAVIGSSWKSVSWVGGPVWKEGSWTAGAWLDDSYVWEDDAWKSGAWEAGAWANVNAWGECGWIYGSWADIAEPPRIRPSTEYSGREKKAARFGGLHQRLLEDDEIILMLLKKAIEAGVFE